MKKYIILTILLLTLGGCKTTSYHETSNNFWFWTDKLQRTKHIKQAEMKDQDHARFYNDKELRLRADLTVDQIAETASNVSKDPGAHFDKGDLMDGGYDTVSVPARSLGVVQKIVGDTVFVYFDEDKQILFPYVKINKKDENSLYQITPFVEYEMVYELPHKEVISSRYDKRTGQRYDTYKMTPGGMVRKKAGEYLIYEGKKYYFYFNDERKQFKDGPLLVSFKKIGDIGTRLKGVPVLE